MNYYNEIKNELINNEINRKVKEYSKRLTADLNKKYDISTLNKMKKFYLLLEKLATVSPNLSYSHFLRNYVM